MQLPFRAHEESHNAKEQTHVLEQEGCTRYAEDPRQVWPQEKCVCDRRRERCPPPRHKAVLCDHLWDDSHEDDRPEIHWWVSQVKKPAADDG